MDTQFPVYCLVPMYLPNNGALQPAILSHVPLSLPAIATREDLGGGAAGSRQLPASDSVAPHPPGSGRKRHPDKKRQRTGQDPPGRGRRDQTLYYQLDPNSLKRIDDRNEVWTFEYDGRQGYELEPRDRYEANEEYLDAVNGVVFVTRDWLDRNRLSAQGLPALAAVDYGTVDNVEKVYATRLTVHLQGGNSFEVDLTDPFQAETRELPVSPSEFAELRIAESFREEHGDWIKTSDRLAEEIVYYGTECCVVEQEEGGAWFKWNHQSTPTYFADFDNRADVAARPPTELREGDIGVWKMLYLSKAYCIRNGIDWRVGSKYPRSAGM